MVKTRDLFLSIGELAERSQTSKQLIHYYLRRDYLHPPIYKRGNQAYYDETHLERLQFIKRCKKEGIPLPFTIELWIRTVGEKKPERENSQHQKQKKDSPTRKQIITVASQRFLHKGYHNTSITEIMDAVGFTKPTFYYYFENKRDLYLTCLDSTFEGLSPWIEKFRWVKDPLTRMKMRLDIAHTYASTFLTAMSLLKESLCHDDAEERRRAELILRRTWVKPLMKELEHGMRSGVFRPVDSEIVALALISVTETLVYRGIVRRKHGGKAILNAVIDLVLNGLLNSPPPQ